MGSMTQASGSAEPPPPVLPAPPVLPPPSASELEDLELSRRDGLTAPLNGWSVWNSTGDANSFHHYQPDHVGHEIWVRDLDRMAVVLGSTQTADVLNPGIVDLDFEVCRRRSGGGLVHLDTSQDVWIDVLLPVSSPLWHADVGRSFHWLGDVWAALLADLVPDALVSAHRGPNQGSGRILCFAGLGHGEVTVDGRKVVGLSQRRTRQWARLQCAIVQHWPADDLFFLLRGLDEDSRAPDPRSVLAGLRPEQSAIDRLHLITRFLEAVTRRTPHEIAE